MFFEQLESNKFHYKESLWMKKKNKPKYESLFLALDIK